MRYMVWLTFCKLTHPVWYRLETYFRHPKIIILSQRITYFHLQIHMLEKDGLSQGYLNVKAEASAHKYGSWELILRYDYLARNPSLDILVSMEGFWIADGMLKHFLLFSLSKKFQQYILSAVNAMLTKKELWRTIALIRVTWLIPVLKGLRRCPESIFAWILYLAWYFSW